MKVLVTLPHASTVIPPDIQNNNINHQYDDEILLAVDTGSGSLYDFPNCQKLAFPWHRGFVDVNQKELDNSAPVTTIKNHPLYKVQPSEAERIQLLSKYWVPFHIGLNKAIEEQKPDLIFDGHTTETGDRDPFGDRFTCDIAVSNMQISSETDPKAPMVTTCPKAFMDAFVQYVEDATWIKVDVNNKYMTKTYGQIESYFPLCPVLCVETNKKLFMDMKTGTVFPDRIAALRTVFSAALSHALSMSLL
jgi:N-formylglutamate amidohydrolase